MSARAAFADLLRQADHRMVAHWVRAISVSPDRVRRQLRAQGLPFWDGEDRPDMNEVDRTANWCIQQARANGRVLGGVAGLGGLASIPPEALAQIVATIRLGQRLCIVYGFDLDTDRGRMALWSALAAGWQVTLPEQGPVGMRVSDLPGVLVPGVGQPQDVMGQMMHTVVRSASWGLARRVSRLVPLVGAGVSADSGGQAMDGIGRRMRDVLRSRRATAPLLDIEDAIEVV